jgi:hypothetical protein
MGVALSLCAMRLVERWSVRLGELRPAGRGRGLAVWCQETLRGQVRGLVWSWS